MTKVIVILDHHRRCSDVIENAVLSYIEPFASSACEMVAEILQYFTDDVRLKTVEADCIYAGIIVDTNNFVAKTGVRTFEAAAYLRRSGADVTRVRSSLGTISPRIRQGQKPCVMRKFSCVSMRSPVVQVKIWRARQ